MEDVELKIEERKINEKIKDESVHEMLSHYDGEWKPPEKHFTKK